MYSISLCRYVNDRQPSRNHRRSVAIFTSKQILDALTELCARHGQTIEEREAAFGCDVGEFRKWLHPPEKPQLNRNLRVMTAALQLDSEDFMDIYRAQTGNEQ